MTTVKELHQKAMDIAHEAIIARNSGDSDKADQLILQAYEFELLAASQVPNGQQSEPTKSILYRSAASLAFQADQYNEAIRLIAIGLSGYPPPRIQHDLLNLLDQVKFKLYLTETEQDLADEGLLVVMRGKAVDVGRVLYKEFKERYENTISLIDKTTQRLTNRPYKRGRDSAAYTYQKVIEIPSMQNSFAISLKLLSPPSPSLLLPSPVDVIDEVVYGIALVGNGQESELREHIDNERYYTHFVTIARRIAPDGENIEHIGFVSQMRSASLSRTKSEIPPISVLEPNEASTLSEKLYSPIEQKGRLAYADDLEEQNTVGIDIGEGKSMKIKLMEGIDEIVIQNWNKVVTVIGVYDGEYIHATDIISHED